MRGYAIDMITFCQRLMHAAEMSEPDAIGAVLPMLLIAECTYVAAFTQAPLTT
jgi:hypothetical protein